MNDFNKLAKVALNEASLGDYVRAAGRAVTHTAANAVKGVAKSADFFARQSGMKYGGEFGSIASKAGNIGNKMKEWGTKHKQEIEKRDLKSAPYILLTKQQDMKLLPVAGEYLSTVMPDSKQIVRMQIVDVSTNATAAKGEENNEAAKVTGGVTVVSQPVEQNNQFDTAITKFTDINKPLQSTTTTTFLKNNAITRLPQLNAIVTKKEHDPLFGNQLSWQLRAPSLQQNTKTETMLQPIEHKSLYTDTESNHSYIFRGVREGGWAPYNLTTHKIGMPLHNAELQKRITKAWQAQQALKSHK